MADTKTPEDRSRNMAAIRSKDTKPEVYLRKKLFSEGFRYRKNVHSIPGHPDAFLRKYNTAVFVNGCFWHRHQNCKYSYFPKSRTEFWRQKFERNVARDQEIRSILFNSGYKCLVVWECTIRNMKKSDLFADDVINRIKAFFDSPDKYLEI